MKKRLYQNVLILIVGLILRWFILSYLSQHPWEKASIMPSLKMLWEKALWLSFRITGRDPSLIERKSSLIKNFDELAYLVSNNPSCVSPELVATIQKSRDDLAVMSYDAIATQQYLYYSRAIDLKQKIDEYCSEFIP